STALAPSETYPLSLHDALPICRRSAALLRTQQRSRVAAETHGRRRPPERDRRRRRQRPIDSGRMRDGGGGEFRVPAGGTERAVRSEEHTSELQSRGHLVCRLLL